MDGDLGVTGKIRRNRFFVYIFLNDALMYTAYEDLLVDNAQ